MVLDLVPDFDWTILFDLWYVVWIRLLILIPGVVYMSKSLIFYMALLKLNQQLESAMLTGI